MSLIYLTVLLVLLQLTEFIEFILLFFIIVTTGQEKFWLRHNRFCKLVSCRLRIGDKATGDNITELFLNGWTYFESLWSVAQFLCTSVNFNFNTDTPGIDAGYV